MKILPEKKLFLSALGIAFVLNIGELFRIDGTTKLIAYFIDTLLYAILILILMRIIIWIWKKIGSK